MSESTFISSPVAMITNLHKITKYSVIKFQRRQIYDRKNDKYSTSSVDLKYVVVHLDLKGAPPKLKYLESLLPVFRDYGVNGLLMEYEDMFPYEGKIVNISSRACYNRNELKKFLSKCELLGIEIIPLVQTFGHMEHALKLQEFRNLRESPRFPDSICPSKAGSIRLIKEMLTQVINFHTSIIPLKHFHIGFDEVYHINTCNQCLRRNITNMNLFYKHFQIVDTTIKRLSPHTKILFWGDMLQGNHSLQPSPEFITNSEPVYWNYRPYLKNATKENIRNYHRKFKNIWMASAFKGADGRTTTFPNLKNRFMNNVAWLNFTLNHTYGEENRKSNFTGIILTGWSRFSHMEPLCELLPAAMPSLVLNLILIQTLKKGVVMNDTETLDSKEFFSKHILDKFNQRFNCKKMKYVDDFVSSKCSFKDGKFFNDLNHYDETYYNIRDEFTNNDSVIASIRYYSEIGNINMITAKALAKWCKTNLRKISQFKANVTKVMSEYYERDVVEEYVTYKTFDNEIILEDILGILKAYLPTRTWDRRPAHNNISII